jgi:hypothetical protein
MGNISLCQLIVPIRKGMMSCIDGSFFPRVVVIVVPPRVVVSVAAQSFEPGSDIDTKDRGIVTRNSVEYGMSFESPLAFAPSFPWS